MSVLEFQIIEAHIQYSLIIQKIVKELAMKKRWLESLAIFTHKTCIILFEFLLIGCSSSSHSDLWAGDKPKHHTEKGFRNYPLIEPANTQGFKFIWNRIFSSSKSDNIPADHLIDEKKAIDRFKKLSSKDTITWIGQSTVLLKINHNQGRNQGRT